MMEDHREDMDLARALMEELFRSAVEYGDIEIVDRTQEEIFADFIKYIKEIQQSLSEGQGFNPALDHRDSILERAQIEAAEDRREISITLYATWLEHFINSMLDHAFHRKGLRYDDYKSLIRELRLPTKARALWKVSGLTPLDDSDVQLIEHIGNLRNAFIHYKWQALSEDEQDRQKALVEGAVMNLEGLVRRLVAIEHAELWHGRREELLSAFRDKFPKE